MRFQEGVPIQASIPLARVGKCLLSSPPLGLQSSPVLRASSYKMWGISGFFAAITHPFILPLSKHLSNCKFLIIYKPGSWPSVPSLCFLFLYKPSDWLALSLVCFPYSVLLSSQCVTVLFWITLYHSITKKRSRQTKVRAQIFRDKTWIFGEIYLTCIGIVLQDTQCPCEFEKEFVCQEWKL